MCIIDSASARISPDKSYDARPDAPIPNSGQPTTGGMAPETDVDYGYMNGTAGRWQCIQ